MRRIAGHVKDGKADPLSADGYLYGEVSALEVIGLLIRIQKRPVDVDVVTYANFLTHS